MRVGVLLLRAVELFHALGGDSRVHATQESLHPAVAGDGDAVRAPGS